MNSSRVKGLLIKHSSDSDIHLAYLYSWSCQPVWVSQLYSSLYTQAFPSVLSWKHICYHHSHWLSPCVSLQEPLNPHSSLEIPIFTEEFLNHNKGNTTGVVVLNLEKYPVNTFGILQSIVLFFLWGSIVNHLLVRKRLESETCFLMFHVFINC